MDANADKGLDGILKLCCFCNAVFWNGHEQWVKLKLGTAQTLPSIFCAHRVDPDGQLNLHRSQSDQKCGIKGTLIMFSCLSVFRKMKKIRPGRTSD